MPGRVVESLRGLRLAWAQMGRSERFHVALAVTMSLVTLYEVSQRRGGYGQGWCSLKTFEPPPINWSKIPSTEPCYDCRMERHIEYGGAVVKIGSDHLTITAEECCQACKDEPDCNVWVWCARMSDCAPGHFFRECWLKKSTFPDVLKSEGFHHERIPWTSGGVFNPEMWKSHAEADRQRLMKMAKNPSLPIVWLDIAVNYLYYGRVYIVLYADKAPLASENFRQLCTGEAGLVPAGRDNAGNRYHLADTPFYRIIDRFMCQAGAPTDSVYGGMFRDDPEGLKLSHNRTGLLSMANDGPNTNTAHFGILMAPADYLDGHHVIFGEIIGGIEAVYQVNKLSRLMPENTHDHTAGATILDSGQADRRHLNLERIVRSPYQMKLNPDRIP